MNQLTNNPPAISRQLFFSSFHTAAPFLVLHWTWISPVLSVTTSVLISPSLFPALSAVFRLQYNSHRSWFFYRSNRPDVRLMIFSHSDGLWRSCSTLSFPTKITAACGRCSWSKTRTSQILLKFCLSFLCQLLGVKEWPPPTRDSRVASEPLWRSHHWKA